MTAPGVTPIVSIEGVHKSFGPNKVLDDVSLTVVPGECLCIIGPSGSGKSTLLRCINALERIDKGRIVEDNFHRYNILRLAEMPKVETVIVPTYDFWGGVGEPTICVVSPSVMNAIFAATGKPMRTLPLRNPVEALAKA